MADRIIESPDNPSAKLWLSLLEARGLRKHRRFLLAGRKTVREALAQHPDRFEALLLPPNGQDGDLPLPAGLERIRLGQALVLTSSTSPAPGCRCWSASSLICR